MREIKFRGKCKYNGEWVYGNLVYNLDPTKEQDTVREAYIRTPLGILSSGCEVHPESVGEFSGLKDRNGVEIYEGDIVQAKSHSPSEYVIKFIEGGFCATHEDLEGYPIDLNHFYPSVGCQIEVIGNIHTKPTPMYNLSELIKTDCCIDCGTNEKLREVVGKIPHAKSVAQIHVGTGENDIYLLIESGKHTTYTGMPFLLKSIPLASINIDL